MTAQRSFTTWPFSELLGNKMEWLGWVGCREEVQNRKGRQRRRSSRVYDELRLDELQLPVMLESEGMQDGSWASLRV
jgi:hypothetical protein